MIVDILKKCDIIRKTPKGEYTNTITINKEYKIGMWNYCYELRFDLFNSTLQFCIHCYFGVNNSTIPKHLKYDLADPEFFKKVKADYRAIRQNLLSRHRI